MAIEFGDDLIKRIKPIKLFIMDVDGVMTDGSVIYNDKGEETKFFNVRDGHGIKMLQRAGIKAAIITARVSEVVVHRAKNLGIELLYQGAIDKAKAYEDLLEKEGIKPDETAYMGDDVVDIPVLKKAGLAIGVADGVDEVRERVHYITVKPGGKGAVREAVELILKAQGKWDEAVRRYL